MKTPSNSKPNAAAVKAATMTPKKSAQYIAGAKGSGMCTCGCTLGK